MKRGPVFWALVICGGGAVICCLGSLLVLGVMGAVADEGSSPASPTSGGGSWVPAGEVARGSTVTQSLSGGRWVYQSGGAVDTTVARVGSTEWVQTNTSGSLYAFTFESDGSYTFEWASAVTLFGGTSRSSCIETGSWTQSGTQLTLEPNSQHATYVTTAGLKQDKEDVDLSPRTYQVVDIELEGITAAGASPGRFPGIELSGPGAKFDISRERYELDLQRL